MNRSIKKLSVMLDLEGCPNHCRHCWLGERKKGKLSIEDLIWTANAFKGWRDEWVVGIEELGFHTWWREPDYRNDYRKLWELERNLSDPDARSASNCFRHGGWRGIRSMRIGLQRSRQKPARSPFSDWRKIPTGVCGAGALSGTSSLQRSGVLRRGSYRDGSCLSQNDAFMSWTIFCGSSIRLNCNEALKPSGKALRFLSEECHRRGAGMKLTLCGPRRRICASFRKH